MTANKTRNLILNLIAPLAIAVAFVACGKAEKTAPTATTPTAPTAVAEKAEPASTLSELPQLAPEAVAIIASNKTDVVYNQVFWITNSAIPSVQKALALMEILPNF